MSGDQSLRERYAARFASTLGPLADRLQQHLKDLLSDSPRVDSVRARPKSIDRFMQKAAKQEEGHDKYGDPLNQIQDQVGARIIVFYPGDVDRISQSIVRQYFRAIEDRIIVPDSPQEFGYEGRHFVLFLPTDILDRGWSRDDYPTFFELQVKTLFQHAWAEANHDLAYKASTELTVDQRRKVAFTAAQAWGADQVFQDLARELRVFDSSPATDGGALAV